MPPVRLEPVNPQSSHSTIKPWRSPFFMYYTPSFSIQSTCSIQVISMYQQAVLQAFRFMVGPGHCPMITKYGPSLFKAVGPVDPSFLVVKKSHINKNIHLTASLQTPQNRKNMYVVNTVKHVISSH